MIPIRQLLTLLIISFSLVTKAQEMLGITGISYSGIHGAFINPSLPALSPLYMDINIGSTHLFVENNYIFMPQEEKKFKRLFHYNEFPALQPDEKFYYDYYTPSIKKGYISARITGPSIAIMKGRHSAGFYTSVRSVTAVRNFPMTLAKFFFEGLHFAPQYDRRYTHSGTISFANLTWAELAFNYAFIFKRNTYDSWALGLTAKRLIGHSGAYAYATHLDYIVPHHDTLIIHKADMEGGLALPINYQNNEFVDSPLIRGTGMGFDVGLTYEKKRRLSARHHTQSNRRLCAQPYSPYQYRVGMSLLDIGSIKFTNQALKLSVDNGDLFWPGLRNEEFTNINDLISNVSERFFDDALKMIEDSEFTIGLPMALSTQADLNIRGNWYGSSTIVIPLNSGRASVSRPSLFAVGARYETMNLHLGMIASLNYYSKFHLGINGRFRNIFIGSENILSLLNLGDFTGTDIYAGIKINLHKGICRPSSRNNCLNNEYP